VYIGLKKCDDDNEIIAVAIKNTKAVIPAEAGISSMLHQRLPGDPGFRRDDGIVGLYCCRNNKVP
jgi:hypothetical protein